MVWKYRQSAAGAGRPLPRIVRCYGLARSALIYRSRPWRAYRARRLYGQFVRPGDLCFDIGAHLGDRIGTFLALGARVVAVEPQPDLLRLLRLLYGRDERVTLVNAALGASAGRLDMMISSRTPTMSTLSASWADRVGNGVRWDRKVPVAVERLESLISAHGLPAFCKIDVEGFESRVLAGLETALPALSFEYLPRAMDLAFACLDRLAVLGSYRFNISERETMRLKWPAWRSRGALDSWLASRTATCGSGDIYAVRVTGTAGGASVGPVCPGGLPGGLS